MKIAAIKIGKISVPLKKPFKTALRVAYTVEDIVVKVIADSGETGYGCGPPTAVITGDTQGSIAAAVKDYIEPSLKGMDVSCLETIMTKLDTSVRKNSTARAAVDMAVYDLFGQLYKIPLYKLFGGYRQKIITDLTISVNQPEEMVADAKAAVAAGYTELKIKVGTDAVLDLARVKSVRSAVGSDISLRLDANQGWKPKEAVRLIRKMEDLGLAIEFVEQPVKAHDLAGLKFVTDNVETAIMADEAVFGPFEAWQILSQHAADLLNIKLMKAGGLHNALKICQFAATMGVECMIGCMMESKIGITAAAALAAGQPNITKTDLDAASLLAADPVLGGVTFSGNAILLPDTPGLGINGINGWQELPN